MKFSFVVLHRAWLGFTIWFITYVYTSMREFEKVESLNLGCLLKSLWYLSLKVRWRTHPKSFGKWDIRWYNENINMNTNTSGEMRMERRWERKTKIQTDNLKRLRWLQGGHQRSCQTINYSWEIHNKVAVWQSCMVQKLENASSVTSESQELIYFLIQNMSRNWSR